MKDKSNLCGESEHEQPSKNLVAQKAIKPKLKGNLTEPETSLDKPKYLHRRADCENTEILLQAVGESKALIIA